VLHRTVITKDDHLLTAVGQSRLPKHFSLGPLGQLLMKGKAVPAGAAWSEPKKLVGANGTVLAHF